MEKNDNKKDLLARKESQDEKSNPPGNPIYPPSEDIYNNAEREEDVDPADVSKTKKSTRKNKTEKRNEKDFNEDKSGSDLDVPGSELDDKEENVGSEDEENNYYSLGGDDHNDLEEDRGD